MLLVKKLTKTAKLPIVAYPRETLGSDIFSDENITIPPNVGRWISTGIAIRFATTLLGPFQGCTIETRSSFADKDVFVVGGIIDAGFCGEIKVRLYNGGSEPFNVFCGDKIAQLIKHSEMAEEVKEVDSFIETDRGIKGFGSTGK